LVAEGARAAVEFILKEHGIFNYVIDVPSWFADLSDVPVAKGASTEPVTRTREAVTWEDVPPVRRREPRKRTGTDVPVPTPLAPLPKRKRLTIEEHLAEAQAELEREVG
jgi:hypothetical protein